MIFMKFLSIIKRLSVLNAKLRLVRFVHGVENATLAIAILWRKIIRILHGKKTELNFQST
jgi:hypothetical protein